MNTQERLAEWIYEELLTMAREPPIDDIYLELALWRAMYKFAHKHPSLKASSNAVKSNAKKKARIKIAREHIDWAIEECNLQGKKPNQKNIESALAKLNDPRIFSYESNLSKSAIVKSNTIKEYLLELKKSKIEEC